MHMHKHPQPLLRFCGQFLMRIMRIYQHADVTWLQIVLQYQSDDCRQRTQCASSCHSGCQPTTTPTYFSFLRQNLYILILEITGNCNTRLLCVCVCVCVLFSMLCGIMCLCACARDIQKVAYSSPVDIHVVLVVNASHNTAMVIVCFSTLHWHFLTLQWAYYVQRIPGKITMGILGHVRMYMLRSVLPTDWSTSREHSCLVRS